MSSKTKSNQEKKKKKITSSKEKKLEYTTRIRIDEDRLNDSESLDVSFLEKRTNSDKVKKDLFGEKKSSNIKIVLVVLFLLLLLPLLGYGILFLYNNFYNNKVVEDEVQKKVIDNTVLMVGDIYTHYYDFEYHNFDYEIIKSYDDNMTTSYLLNNIDDYIYYYEPSHVVLHVGIYDLIAKEKIDDIIDNIDTIVSDIAENLPNVSIYIESLFPINSTAMNYSDDILGNSVSNDDIKLLNDQLIKLCRNHDITYVDTYNVLSDSNVLNSAYTYNGVYLNDDGYKTVSEEIKKVLDDVM